MSEAEVRPWDKKEVGRDNGVPPYPVACSGTTEHAPPQTQKVGRVVRGKPGDKPRWPG